MDMNLISYRDISQRENDERNRLRERLNQLDRSARARAGAGVGGETDPVFYSVEEKAERDRIADTLQVLIDHPDEYCDPLYVAVRDQFNDRATLLVGVLGNPAGSLSAEPLGVALQMMRGDLSASAAVDCALTLGLLMVDAAVPPVVKLNPNYVDLDTDIDTIPTSNNGADGTEFAIVTDRDDRNWPAMGKAFFKALGEAQSYKPLSSRVLAILAREAIGDDDSDPPIVSAAEFAKVMRALLQKGVNVYETQLGRKVSEALDQVQLVVGDGVTTEIGIDLPDLDATSNSEIVADNIRLMGPVICAAMLDELKAFQVVDRLLENAQNGQLPIGKGNAGALLYKRWKESPNRMSETERRDLYAMTMGQPGGNPNIQGNTDFNDLWLRFVSSVSQFVRQQDVDRLLRAALPSATGAQQMRKAARDLATNLSLHGFGMTYYAALELQGEIKQMIALLSDDEIKGATGAKDMWGVIDVIATTNLGGARTSSRYKTLATCGAIITAWLANNIEKISRPMGVLLDMMDVRSPMPRTAGQRATSTPTDYDLVNACELWLADTATSDSRVDEMSQPRVSPVMTSQPVQMPAFAREFMDEIPGMAGGAPVGMSLGLRNGQSRH
jgi:hypothetical protein